MNVTGTQVQTEASYQEPRVQRNVRMAAPGFTTGQREIHELTQVEDLLTDLAQADLTMGDLNRLQDYRNRIAPLFLNRAEDRETLANILGEVVLEVITPNNLDTEGAMTLLKGFLSPDSLSRFIKTRGSSLLAKLKKGEVISEKIQKILEDGSLSTSEGKKIFSKALMALLYNVIAQGRSHLEYIESERHDNPLEEEALFLLKLSLPEEKDKRKEDVLDEFLLERESIAANNKTKKKEKEEIKETIEKAFEDTRAAFNEAVNQAAEAAIKQQDELRENIIGLYVAREEHLQAADAQIQNAIDQVEEVGNHVNNNEAEITKLEERSIDQHHKLLGTIKVAKSILGKVKK